MMEQQLQMNLEKLNPFKANEKDYNRWNGQLKAIYDLLSDGEWHTREELESVSKAKQPTARISELRKRGYVIDCVRQGEDGSTMYKITDYLGYDTTKEKHCRCCRYNYDFVESYTG